MANIKYRPIGLNKYEYAHNVYKDSPLYDEQSWQTFLEEGEDALNSYLSNVSRYDQIGDVEQFKLDNQWDDMSPDLKNLAMYIEFDANNTDLNTYDVVTGYDANGKEIKEKRELTEKQYYQSVIDQWKEYNSHQQSLFEEQQRKNNRGFWSKMWSGIGAILGELGLGILDTMESWINFADAIIGSLDQLDEIGEGKFLDEFRERMSDGRMLNFGGDAKDWFPEVVDEMRTNLYEWERTNTTYVSINGERTSLGKILGDTAYSIAQMIPAMLLSTATAYSTGTKTLPKAVGTVSFYTGSFESRLQDKFNSEDFNSVSTEFIIGEALLETTAEWAVEFTLGKFFGETGIDMLRNATTVTGRGKLLTGLAKYFKDAFQEGLEETLQEFSNYFATNLAGLIHNEYRTDIDWETVGYAAIGGFMSSLFMGGFSLVRQLQTDKRASFKFVANDETYKSLGQEGVKETKKQKTYRNALFNAMSIKNKIDAFVDGTLFARTGVNELSTYQLALSETVKDKSDFGYSLKAVASSFDKNVQSLDLSKKSDVKLLAKMTTQMYQNYKVIMDMYGEIGVEKAQAAEKLLEDIQEYAKRKDRDKLEYAEKLQTYGNKLANQIGTIAFEYQLSEAKKAKLIDAANKVEETENKRRAKDKKGEKDKETVEGMKAEIQAIYDSDNDRFVGGNITDPEVLQTAKEMANIYHQDLVLWDNHEIVERDDVVFTPIAAAKNLGAKEICKSAAERTIVNEVLEIFDKDEYKGVFESIRNDYNEMSGLKQKSNTETLDVRVAYELLFNKSFYNYLLNLNNENAFNVLKTLDALALTIAKKENDQSMINEYHKIVRRIRMTMGPSLAMYFCNNPYANLDKVTVFNENQLAFIANHRYNDLVKDTLIKADTKNPEYKKALNLMINRINGLTVSDDKKKELIAYISDTNNTNAAWIIRECAIDEVNQGYLKLITNKYNNQNLLASTDPLSAMFNSFLQLFSVTVKEINDGVIKNQTLLNKIRDSQGGIDKDSIYAYFKKEFELYTNNELTVDFGFEPTLSKDEEFNVDDGDKEDYVKIKQAVSNIKSKEDAQRLINEDKNAKPMDLDYNRKLRAIAAEIYLGNFNAPIAARYRHLLTATVRVSEKVGYESLAVPNDFKMAKGKINDRYYQEMNVFDVDIDKYVSDLLKINELEQVYTNFNDIVNNPYRYLKDKEIDTIRKQYKVVTPATTFLYLQRKIIQRSGEQYSITINKDGKYIPAKLAAFEEFFNDNVINEGSHSYIPLSKIGKTLDSIIEDFGEKGLAFSTDIYDENGKLLYGVLKITGKTREQLEQEFPKYRIKEINYSLFDKYANQKEVPVTEFIKSDKLPENLRNIKIKFADVGDNKIGQHITGEKDITINTHFGRVENGQLLVTILHEVQHVFQDFNNQAPGGILIKITDAMLEDIKKHVPNIFDETMTIQKQKSVAQHYLYSMYNGELYARGESIRLWHIHPMYINHFNSQKATVITPWGSKYDFIPRKKYVEAEIKAYDGDRYSFENVFDLNSDIKPLPKGQIDVNDFLNDVKNNFPDIYNLLKYRYNLERVSLGELNHTLIELFQSFSDYNIVDKWVQAPFMGTESVALKNQLKTNISDDFKLLSLMCLYLDSEISISFSEFLKSEVPFLRLQNKGDLHRGTVSAIVGSDVNMDMVEYLYNVATEGTMNKNKIDGTPYAITGSIAVSDMLLYVPLEEREGIFDIAQANNVKVQEIDWEKYGEGFDEVNLPLIKGLPKNIQFSISDDYQAGDIEFVGKADETVKKTMTYDNAVDYKSSVDKATKFANRNRKNGVKTYKKDLAEFKLPKYVVNDIVENKYDKRKDKTYTQATDIIRRENNLKARKSHAGFKKQQKSSARGNQVFIKRAKGTNLEYWVDRNPDLISYLSGTTQDFVIAADDLSKLPKEIADKIKNATLSESDIYNYIRNHYDDDIPQYMFNALKKSFFKLTPFKSFAEVKLFIKENLHEKGYAIKAALSSVGLESEVFEEHDWTSEQFITQINKLVNKLNVDKLSKKLKELEGKKKDVDSRIKELRLNKAAYSKSEFESKLKELETENKQRAKEIKSTEAWLKAGEIYRDTMLAFGFYWVQEANSKGSLVWKKYEFDFANMEDALPDATLGLLNFFNGTINDLAYVAGNAKKAAIRQDTSLRENKGNAFLYKFRKPKGSHGGNISLDATVEGAKGDDSDTSLSEVIADTKTQFEDYTDAEMRQEIKDIVKNELLEMIKNGKDVKEYTALFTGLDKRLRAMDEDTLLFYISLLTIRKDGLAQGQEVDSLNDVFDIKPEEIIVEKPAETGKVDDTKIRKELRLAKARVRRNLNGCSEYISQTVYKIMPDKYKKYFNVNDNFKPVMDELNKLSKDELDKFNEEIKEFKSELSKGYYDSRKAKTTLEELKVKLAKEREKNLKLKKELSNKKVKTVYTQTIGESGSIESDRPTPEILKKLFNVTFGHQSDRKMKFYAVKDERHMKVTMKEFFEENREAFNYMTYNEALEIVDYFENVSTANNLYTPYDAFRVYTLGFIIEQLQDGVWTDNNYLKERAEKMISALLENASRIFNAWRPMMRKLNPKKVIIQAMLRNYDIDMEGEQVLDDLVNAMKGATQHGTDEKFIANLQTKVNAFEKRVMEKYCKGDNNKVTHIRDKLLTFRRAAMLSMPATWARNKISNVVLNGFYVGKTHIGGLNDLADIFGKVIPMSKKYKPTTFQYNLSGIKVTDETSAFVKKWLTDNNLLDLLGDNLSKVDTRETHVRSKDIVDNLTTMIMNAAAERALSQHTFGKGKATLWVEQKLNKQLDHGLLDNAINFVFARQNDKKDIQRKALIYIGKMLETGLPEYETKYVDVVDENGNNVKTKTGKNKREKVTVLKRDADGNIVTKKVDLSKGLTSDIYHIIANAYSLAAYELMHRSNFMSDTLNALRAKHPNAHFVINLMEPFLSSSWNWFMDSLQMNPISLVANIIKLQRIEKYADRLSERMQKGERGVPSPEFAEMLIRRNIGKGMIGSVLLIIGLFLAKFGVIELDDDDEMPKIKIGNVYFDISNVYGSSSILTGAMLGRWSSENDMSAWSVIESAFNQQFEDSFFSSTVDSFKYNDTVFEWFTSLGFNVLGGFVPNLWKSVVRLTQNHKVKYSSNTVLNRLQQLGMSTIPALEYAMPKYIDPYTGERREKYSIPALGQFVNSISPVSVKLKNSSAVEDAFIANGYKLSALKGDYKAFTDLGVSLSADDIEKLNEYYGKLNAKIVTEFINNKKKYSVEIKEGKYKELYYKDMSIAQRKSVLSSIARKNANYAKIYVWTELGHKYYGSSELRDELRKIGVNKNVYLGNKEFVK